MYPFNDTFFNIVICVSFKRQFLKVMDKKCLLFKDECLTPEIDKDTAITQPNRKKAPKIAIFMIFQNLTSNLMDFHFYDVCFVVLLHNSKLIH